VSAIRDTRYGIDQTVPAIRDTRVRLVILVYCQARAMPNDRNSSKCRHDCRLPRGPVTRTQKSIVFRILKTVAPSNDSTYDVGTDAP
jgi:hypothetical protein